MENSNTFLRNSLKKEIKNRLKNEQLRAPGDLTDEQFLDVMELFDYKCAYCNHDLEPNKWAIEHVNCVDKGGKTDVGNCLPACTKCNNKKGARSVEGWFTLAFKENIIGLDNFKKIITYISSKIDDNYSSKNNCYHTLCFFKMHDMTKEYNELYNICIQNQFFKETINLSDTQFCIKATEYDYKITNNPEGTEFTDELYEEVKNNNYDVNIVINETNKIFEFLKKEKIYPDKSPEEIFKMYINNGGYFTTYDDFENTYKRFIEFGYGKNDFIRNGFFTLDDNYKLLEEINEFCSKFSIFCSELSQNFDIKYIKSKNDLDRIIKIIRLPYWEIQHEYSKGIPKPQELMDSLTYERCLSNKIFSLTAEHITKVFESFKDNDCLRKNGDPYVNFLNMFTPELIYRKDIEKNIDKYLDLIYDYYLFSVEDENEKSDFYDTDKIIALDYDDAYARTMFLEEHELPFSDENGKINPFMNPKSFNKLEETIRIITGKTYTREEFLSEYGPKEEERVANVR